MSIELVVRCIYEGMDCNVWVITVTECTTHFIIDVPYVLLVDLILTHYAISSSIHP